MLVDTSVGASLSELLRQQTWRPIINRRSLATSSVCAPPPLTFVDFSV